MHNDNMESVPERDDDVEREAVEAADDTGMVAQQDLLANIGIGDATGGDATERESI